MAIFQKRPPLQRALQSEWRDDLELEELREELLNADIAPREALPLLYHHNAQIRDAGGRLYLKGADAKRMKILVNDMCWKPPAERRYLSDIFGRVPASIMNEVMDWVLSDRDQQVVQVGWEVALSLGGGLRARYLKRAVLEAPRGLRVPALRRLLADMDPADLLDVLIKVCRDEDARLVSMAIEALVQIDDPVVIEVMVDFANHENAGIRDRSRDYLLEAARKDPENMRERMLETLSDGDDGIRRLGIEILMMTGEPLQVLAEILLYSRVLLGWLRMRILDTLRTFGDDVLVPALELLGHKDEDVRSSALILAENFDDPRLVDPVCKLLKDDDWWLRILACDILGKLGDDRAVPHLIEALDDEDARWAAIDGLAQIGSEDALKPLVKTLNDPRKEVRLEVVNALGCFSDKRLLTVLKRVTEVEPTSEVRTRAQEVMRDMAKRLNLEAWGSEADTAAFDMADLTTPLDRLLAITRRMQASDLHLSAGEPPYIRLDGKLERIEEGRMLTANEIREATLDIMTERHEKEMWRYGQVDFCYQLPEVGRYRANVFSQRKGWSAVFRVIQNIPPTFGKLRMPPQLADILHYHQGIVIVAGPVGAGKSSTLAALVNLINESKQAHIITLEDPVEFVHPSKSSLLDQREVPTHTESFEVALRAALRQDPDVIMVGEMRDPATIRMALTAAETGHLVLATLHTPSAAGTIARIVDVFPPGEQSQVRASLAESLKFVVAQFLVPRKDEQGRVAVFELMRSNNSVTSMIRENKIHQIPNVMIAGSEQGMQTRDRALMDLVEAEMVHPEVAWRRANQPEMFEPMCSAEFLAQVAHLRKTARDVEDPIL